VFTGIIEETGLAASLAHHATGARLTVTCAQVLTDAAEGVSIAVNGVCLTALDIRADSFSADLAPETLQRSNLGDLQPGTRVNLERPLLPTARLSGHIVQGHVDGTAELLSLDPLGDDNWWLRIRVPAALERYFVEKGSISVDGISLTIAAIKGPEIAITIIPHTYHNTSLSGYRPGARLNIEVDVIAKHVEKLLTYGDAPIRCVAE
jgi:riboflavin synthase